MSPMMMLLKRTGQAGKFRIGVAALCAALGILFLGGFAIGRLSPAAFYALAILATATGAAAMVYLCKAIRCPNCDAKWIWLMASTARHDPLHPTFDSAACTRCAYPADDSTPADD